MTATLFRNVRLIDPQSARDEDGVDVMVDQQRVQFAERGAASQLPSLNDVRVIDGEGRWLMPGFCDMHVHFREPGEEHKEDIRTGLLSAVAGGFVDVCAMPNTKPVNDLPVISEMIVAKSRSLRLARLHPITAITKGLQGLELAEFAAQRDVGAVAASDDGRCVTSSVVMRRALQYAHTFDFPVIQHAEDHALTEGAEMHEGAISTRLGLRPWPRVAEDIIVARDILLVADTMARYHVAHLSTKGAAQLVARAKNEGLRVSAEVTPHHLLLSHESVIGYRTACKVNPPLREPEDIQALCDALNTGVIDVVATDHAPHAFGDKEVEFSEARPGMIGLQFCFSLLLRLVNRGQLRLYRLVAALTSGPARVLGWQVPRVVAGARADLVLFDPSAKIEISRASILSKSINTPFLGESLQGAVDFTMVDGEVVYERIKQGVSQ